MTSPKKLSYYSICIGVVACLFASIWDEDTFKWLLSAAYIAAVGKYFGVTFRSEKIVGGTIHRNENTFNFLNLRGKK